MNFDEERLRDKNPWKCVADAPNLPFRTHTDIRESIANRTYVLHVSYPAARQLAPFVRSYAGRLLNILFGIAPFFMALVVVAFAFWQWSFLLLVGVPVAFLGAWFGHPMNPLKRLMTALTCISVLAAIAVWNQSVAVVVAAWIIPFIGIRAAYATSIRALRNAVLQSEALFLNQYWLGGISLRNVVTGETYFGSSGAG